MKKQKWCVSVVKNAKRKFQWSMYKFKHGAIVEVEPAFSVGSGQGKW